MRTITFPIFNPIPPEKFRDADGDLIFLGMNAEGRTYVDDEIWPTYFACSIQVENDATVEEIKEIIRSLPYGVCNNCRDLAAGSVGGLCDECRPLQVEAIMEKIARDK